MKRVYKEAFEPQDALLIMEKNAKDDYDPIIFPKFLNAVVASLNALQKSNEKGRILFRDEDGLLKESKK